MNNKTFKVVVINPQTKSVYEAQIPAENTLQHWYDTIGNGCTLVTNALSVYDEARDIDNALLMDDEILLRPDDIQGGFTFGKGSPVYTNTAIFSGADNMGETCDTTINAEMVAKQIVWLTREQAIEHAETAMSEPITIISSINE